MATIQAGRPAGGVVARVLDRLRQDGARHVALKAAHELGLYRCCVVDASPLDRQRDESVRIDVTCRALRPEEAEAYAAFRPEQPACGIRRRLEAGDYCHVAWHDGRIVGASWTCTHRAHLGFLGCDLVLSPGTYYVDDNFVVPECRGMGVQRGISRARRRDLIAAGFARSVGVTWPLNRAAYRYLQRSGNPIIGVVGFYGLGPWRRHFLHVESAACGPGGPPLALARR